MPLPAPIESGRVDRRIVIYVSTAQDGLLATKVLNSAGIQAFVCRSLVEMLQALAEGCGALLLAEEVIHGGALQAVRGFVVAQAGWSDLPILVLTARGSDSLDAQRAVELLGNVTLLERPVRTIGLISAARSALRARERQYQVRLADQRKDEFLATLAHELRNPLAPIRTSMSIIAQKQPAPEVQELIGIVERQVMHLTRLVDDLLDVARITTGKVVLRPERTTVRSVLHHALEIASTAMKERHHEVRVQEPDEDYELQADHARVVQSLANLLGNAAKFTPQGGAVTVIAEISGPTVRFTVQDTGRGLAAHEIARIFDLFVQAPAPGEPASGLGIGLNPAKRFAEMHGGSIEVTSDGLDRGSRFVITLPVVVGRLQAPPPAAAPVADPHGEARTLLVVDDNVDAADTLRTFLELEGFQVSVVYDGQAAVDAVQRERPDAVLMDIGMPKMDGYEAARRIRALGTPTRLVALTGWGQDMDRRKAELAGFDRHLVKPVDLAELLRCIESFASAPAQ
jgi:signal transduction histidine kinase/CheY-like chemotaxis protein